MLRSRDVFVSEIEFNSIGDIVYCEALGQHVIILNSLKVVNDLFEKRSHIYSDRPLLPMRDV